MKQENGLELIFGFLDRFVVHYYQGAKCWDMGNVLYKSRVSSVRQR